LVSFLTTFLTFLRGDMASPYQGSDRSARGGDNRSFTTHTKTEPVTAQAFNGNKLRYFSIVFRIGIGLFSSVLPYLRSIKQADQTRTAGGRHSRA
jgi:hypothetical protein